MHKLTKSQIRYLLRAAEIQEYRPQGGISFSSWSPGHFASFRRLRVLGLIDQVWEGVGVYTLSDAGWDEYMHHNQLRLRALANGRQYP
jgi:hypothetical protein